MFSEDELIYLIRTELEQFDTSDPYNSYTKVKNSILWILNLFLTTSSDFVVDEDSIARLREKLIVRLRDLPFPELDFLTAWSRDIEYAN